MSECIEAGDGLGSAPKKRGGSDPSLSVVLVSAGHETALERAFVALSGAAWRTKPELIVIRAGSEGRTRERIQALMARAKCEIRFVDGATSRSAMIDEGMRAASGDIVLVRDDESCADIDWLVPFATRLDGAQEVWVEDAPERRPTRASRHEDRVAVGEMRL